MTQIIYTGQHHTLQTGKMYNATINAEGIAHILVDDEHGYCVCPSDYEVFGTPIFSNRRGSQIARRSREAYYNEGVVGALRVCNKAGIWVDDFCTRCETNVPFIRTETECICGCCGSTQRR